MKYVKPSGEELDTRYSSPHESALRVAYNMGRDDVIKDGGPYDYRGGMFILGSEKRAYDRGWQQEIHDLGTVIKAADSAGDSDGSC